MATNDRVQAGEGMDVEVIRGPRPDNQQGDQAGTAAAEQRLDELARAAGLLPEFRPTGIASRPVAQNPRFWIYRAICVRFKWADNSMVSQADFDAAIQAVANFSV